MRRQASFVLAAVSLLAQSKFNPTTVKEGEQLFTEHCEMCHGPEGDAVPGVDLGHNKFRRAASDADLVKIIKNGIPGTGMPPHNFADFPPGAKSAVSQVESIVVYMHYLAESAASNTVAEGDPARGKGVFEGKGACLTCHRAKGKGSRLGPELSDIGSQ